MTSSSNYFSVVRNCTAQSINYKLFQNVQEKTCSKTGEDCSAVEVTMLFTYTENMVPVKFIQGPLWKWTDRYTIKSHVKC